MADVKKTTQEIGDQIEQRSREGYDHFSETGAKIGETVGDLKKRPKAWTTALAILVVGAAIIVLGMLITGKI